MKTAIFIAIVAACAIAFVWLLTRSRKPLDSNSFRKQQDKISRAELLATPADYTLARKVDVWRTRLHRDAYGDRPRKHYEAPTSSGGDRAYDANSRAERHGVVVGTAHIRKGDRVEKASRTAGDYEDDQAAG